jgi:MoxR-like ATPase
MQTGEDIRILNEKIQHAAVFTDTLKNELAKIIIGQFDMIDRLMIALLSNGHILLEGVPGLAKTLTIKSLAQAVHAKFSRIQFTPDLLPADVTGTMIYNQQRGEFIVRKDPSSLILFWQMK